MSVIRQRKEGACHRVDGIIEPNERTIAAYRREGVDERNCQDAVGSKIYLAGADDLVVLGFSVDDPAEKIKPYAEEYEVNYALLVGNGREDVQIAFGPLLGIPVTVIIGRDGIIAKKHTGIATKEQFEREIKALL